MTLPESASAARSRILLGFAAVYLLWGSTYLAIRFAVATLPPLLMAGTRHLIAGLILYFLMRRLGSVPRPQPVHWRSALLLGGLFLLGGNGLVSWAEQSVPSGITALIVAVVPLWMVLLNAANERLRPRLTVLIGLALGVVGIGLLVLPSFTGAPGHGSAVGICVLLAATFSWAVGSLYAHQAPLPSSVLLGTAMEMLTGGVLCWIAGLSIGEGASLHLGVFTFRSLLSLAYLIVFGSLAGFSAYVWLLKVSTPARVSTYAFVNPVIAVLLGWLFAGEALSLRIMLAGTVIVAAVSLILYFGASHAPPQTVQPPDTERPAVVTSEKRAA
ncbi:MAG TPA: EamA family transporter [Gammaproteobacteria bacterium]|nr:EamA family transporter [Gammaproteobacteria bacterium]